MTGFQDQATIGQFNNVRFHVRTPRAKAFCEV